MHRSGAMEGEFSRKQRADGEDEYQAFSFGRVGRSAQLVLLIRKADGQVEGFPYAQFDGITAEKEENGFTVQFGKRAITIEGRNLGDLFRYVCSFRAAEISEASERDAMRVDHSDAAVWKVNVR